MGTFFNRSIFWSRLTDNIFLPPLMRISRPESWVK
jgi:hypothetical protein